MPSIVIPDRDLVLTSRLTLPGERSAFYRAASRGAWIRVRPGIYIESAAWRGLDSEARHLARARAAATLDPGAIFSHLTAALLWGLPLVDVPQAPQTIVRPTTGGRSSQSTTRFGVRSRNDPVELDGLWVTPLVETIVNVADRFDAAVSIPVIDAALGGRARDSAAVRPDDLAAVPVQHAPRRVGFALGFGDGRAESVGESLSRLAIHRAGLAAPVLQARFDDDRGLVGFADFWWPDSGVIGEFDGLGKYRRDLAGRGRPPEEIVIAEKRREDRMRALGPRVVRWGWATARSVPDLRRLLMGAGVRADSSRPRR